MADKQNNQGRTDRQYLKAMGIDLWIDRDSVLDAIPQPMSASIPATTPAATVTPTSAPASRSTPASKSMAQYSVSELSVAVANLKVTCSETERPAELLVITEGLHLSDECTKLLGSMFKAIEFDRTQWLHAGISEADDAIPISQLESTVGPKALIIMLKTGGNTTMLQSLRGVQHNMKSLKGFMAVSFHPQDLLDNPETKRPAWEDLKQLRQWLT